MCDAEGYLIPFTSAAYPIDVKLLPDRAGNVTTVTHDFQPHDLDIDVHRSFSQADKYQGLLKAHFDGVHEKWKQFCSQMVVPRAKVTRKPRAPPTPSPEAVEVPVSPRASGTSSSADTVVPVPLATPPMPTLSSMLDEIEGWLNQVHFLLPTYRELDRRVATTWTDLQRLVAHRLQTYADFVFYHNEVIRIGKRDAHDHALAYVLGRLRDAAEQLKEADRFPRGRIQYTYAGFLVAIDKFRKDLHEKPW
ncbi:uncharacterized protein LOC62_01G000139 [Vanrija pseudolonga]|uniref:Uncharacterized protein n=1 Tax=Vanrija pseudolonga TaxID=143232 RepID=A0AAF1BMB2_9TREE|nr:hypothetical protein LOC62_01G000139 [Vanrija pseudolonga]